MKASSSLVLLFCLITVVAWVEVALGSCEGPPYLYVTFHGGPGKSDINNIVRYSRDGCTLGNVLHSNTAKDLSELRGLVLIPAVAGTDNLLVANADSQDSRIVLYGACDPHDNNYRPYISDFVVSGTSNAGLDHPYGIRVFPPPLSYTDFANSSLYVSNQGSGFVTYYNLENGDPRPISPFLSNSGPSIPPGSFAQIDKVTDASFRGFAFDSSVGGNIWVADDVAYVLQYNADTGSPESQIPVATPIGIDFFTVGNRELLFVSSNPQVDAQDMVYAYDPTTLDLVMTYGPQHLDHPAGFIAYEDVLFVLSQNDNAIVTFNLTTGEFLEVIVDNLDDQPEQIILGTC